MDQEATIGGTAHEGLLSVDDLVAKIGGLVVEVMHKDRELSESRRSSQAAVAAAMSAASQAKADAEKAKADADTKIAEATAKATKGDAYKESHDRIVGKYNDLTTTCEAVRKELGEVKKELQAEKVAHETSRLRIENLERALAASEERATAEEAGRLSAEESLSAKKKRR